MAENRSEGHQTAITLYKLENNVGKYRLSLDDNILCFADLTKNKDVYTSLFDSPYMNVLKKAHELYGTKVHMNVFYEYKNDEEDRHSFSGERDYFNLSMMTDKYKDEWKANSDWLKLSFHSRAENPDNPYLNVTAEYIKEDIRLVHREILRFAGAESLAEVTTLHWGACNEDGVHALRSAGYRALVGYFSATESGETIVAYCYPYDLVKHINGRDFWVDNKANIVYCKVDMVLNKYQLNEIVPNLEKICRRKQEAGFIELLMHGQYFYSDYRFFSEDFENIILSASRWLTEHGYKSALISEVI